MTIDDDHPSETPRERDVRLRNEAAAAYAGDADDGAATADAVAAVNTPAGEKKPVDMSVLIRYRRHIVEHHDPTSFSVAMIDGPNQSVPEAAKLGPFATLQEAELALLNHDLGNELAAVVVLSKVEADELAKIVADEDNELGSIDEAIHAGVTAVLSALGPLKDQLEAAIAQQAAAGNVGIVVPPSKPDASDAAEESAGDAAKRIEAAAMQPCSACGKTSVPFIQLGQIAACVECDRKWLRIENGLVEAPASASAPTIARDCTCGHGAVFHGLAGVAGVKPGPCVYRAAERVEGTGETAIISCTCGTYTPVTA